jgi:hypothetical protein
MSDMRLIRNILAFLFAFLLILLLFLPVLFISGVLKHVAFIYSAARMVIRTTFWILGVKTVVRGLDAVDLSPGRGLQPPVQSGRAVAD